MLDESFLQLHCSSRRASALQDAHRIDELHLFPVSGNVVVSRQCSYVAAVARSFMLLELLVYCVKCHRYFLVLTLGSQSIMQAWAKCVFFMTIASKI